MTRSMIAATLTAALLGGTALAGPVEDLVAQLNTEGYSPIEIEIKGERTEIEAVLDGVEREIVMVTESGEILSDRSDPMDDDDDHDDDDDDDHDDDD